MKAVIFTWLTLGTLFEFGICEKEPLSFVHPAYKARVHLHTHIGSEVIQVQTYNEIGNSTYRICSQPEPPLFKIKSDSGQITVAAPLNAGYTGILQICAKDEANPPQTAKATVNVRVTE